MAAVVIFSKNVEAQAAFYQAVLQARIVEQGSGHVVLDAGDGEVVIHGIPAGIAKTITIASPPEPRGQAAIKPAFDVDDIGRVRDVASTLGGVINEQKRGFVIRGRQVVDGLDPEGNVIQLRVLVD